MTDITNTTDNAKFEKGGLLSLDELKDFEYIRPEFVAPRLRAKITIEYGAFTCNSACVRLFPESEYIVMLSDSKRKRLAIWSCEHNDKGAIKWSKIKDGKLYPKRVSAKYLGAKIYKMMDWDTNNRYKIIAVYQEFPEKKLALFNLEEVEIYKPENKAGRKKSKKFFPVGWENSFGTPYSEHKATYKIDLDTLHIPTNDSQNNIVARVPTSSEIITRQYYLPDKIAQKEKADE